MLVQYSGLDGTQVGPAGFAEAPGKLSRHTFHGMYSVAKYLQIKFSKLS